MKFIIEIPDNVAVTAEQLRKDVVCIGLYNRGLMCISQWPDVKVVGEDDEPAYALIQEGGSSVEVYVHAHESEEEASMDRFTRRDDGGYRTSDFIEVPPILAGLGETFYGFLDEFVKLALEVSFPEGENPYATEAEDEEQA